MTSVICQDLSHSYLERKPCKAKAMNPIFFFLLLLLLILMAGIRIVFEYKRALKFRFGKYVKTLNPGFRWIIPLVETIQKVDIRVITINIVSQEVMTEDNVPWWRNTILP